MTPSRSDRQQLWACAAVLLALLLGYMLFWWNRGIQLNSNGLGTLAAEDILAGKAPYLTFDFWCPPGHLLVYAGLARIFGYGLIYVRAFAVVERMAIFLLVYFWLARVFSPRAAFLGTFAAGVGFSSDVADVLAHYDFDAVLTSVAAGFAASVAVSSKGRSARIMCFVAGLCAGACMVAKQTQGVGMFLVLLVILTLSGPALGVLVYLLGWMVPVGLTALWLARMGAWQAFVQEAFLQGTSSKGSLEEILLRPLFTLTYEHMLQSALAVALILMAAYGLMAWKEREESGALVRPQTGLPWMVWAACLFALGAGLAWAWFLPDIGVAPRKHQALIGFTAIGIFIGMYGSAALAFAYSWRALCHRLDHAGLQKWTLASVSAMTAYMFSLSWAAYEKMLIPGFAFIVAMTLDRQLRRGWNLRAYAIAALALVLATTAVFRKMTWPYDWANWVDGPVKQETAIADFPEMRGLRVTPETAKFLGDVTKIIDEHSSAGQTIFCYPNYTLFYVLAHRAPATFGLMHWFDIASDAMSREDARRIREHPPAVILFVDLPEDIIVDNERKFRGGRRGGQRDLAAAIQNMPGYRVIETVPIPHKDYPLKIYARN